ncbi:MAG: bisanhydrobacterioruberin hydratase [Haloferacaceae archaeon]
MSERTARERVAEPVRERLPDTRADLERSFDRTVLENRFAIAVVFPAVGALMLVASAEGLLPEPLSFNPWLLLLGVAVMRSPLAAGGLPLLDRRAGAWLGGLVAYTYAIEYVGILTGWPYGYFEYGVSLGPMIGGVPVALPLFFVPLVANAYLLCLLLLGRWSNSTPARLGTVIAFVVAMDVVLDPGAVSLGFWGYDGGGPFYGVPVSNYLGWVLSATVAVVALDRGFDRAGLLRRLESTPFMLDDMVSFVILWGGINVWFGNVVPAVFAVGMAIGLVKTDRFDSELLRPLRR